MNNQIERWMMQSAEEVGKALQSLVSTTPSLQSLCNDPALHTLYRAEYYSLLAGGKRIRPLLTLEVCRALGGKREEAMNLACAVEMVHTYSLIHDDLPCMDNDDLRRGVPTNHKVFGEATAILAGDGLLSDAFSVISSGDALSCRQKLAAVRVLSTAAGSTGMVGGQIMDLEGEQTVFPLDTLMQLHARKTGAMIRASVQLGMIAAGVIPRNFSPSRSSLSRTDEEASDVCLAQGKRPGVTADLTEEHVWDSFTTYASDIGLAFQVVDDVLDVTADAAQLGKSIGKDREEQKTTFLRYYSVEEALQYAEKLSDHACEVIQDIPGTERLCDLARYLARRAY